MIPLTNEILLCDKKIIGDDGEWFNVKYYRLETKICTENSSTLYGVSVRKTAENKQDETIDLTLTDSLEHINYIIHYLAHHKVTPVSVIEVIDDIYDSYSAKDIYS